MEQYTSLQGKEKRKKRKYKRKEEGK